MWLCLVNTQWHARNQHNANLAMLNPTYLLLVLSIFFLFFNKKVIFLSKGGTASRSDLFIITHYRHFHQHMIIPLKVLFIIIIYLCYHLFLFCYTPPFRRHPAWGLFIIFIIMKTFWNLIFSKIVSNFNFITF
jgi:hypothetical protein